MAARVALLVLVGLLALSSSTDALFGFFDPSWNTLRVTWGLKIWQSNVFASMPLTKSDAERKGFVRVAGNSSDECQTGKFLGQRYYKDSDTSLVLLYDKEGYFAGIQTGFPKSLISNETSAWFSQHPFFQNDVIGGNDTYTLTAYLVDPAIICTSGRTESEFQESKSGTQLSVQSGPDPLNDVIEIPLQQDDLAETAWTRGKCFPSMGVHYWYNITTDMNCDNFRPFFLLYNNKKLTGFGWAAMGDFRFSDRYEHPPKDAFKRFLNPVPDCLNDIFDLVGGFTTQHVYMNARPWNLMC